jgi:alanyl-tRNA synthetase
MPTRTLYDPPAPLEFRAQVLAVRMSGDRWEVVLDRTAFYAESGGQPSDRGRLAACEVAAVRLGADGEIAHELLPGSLPPKAGDGVQGEVDARCRRDHREQHSGQHILSRIFADLLGWPTVGFHLGEEVVTIDLDVHAGGTAAKGPAGKAAASAAEELAGRLAAAEAEANRVVRENRPVTVLYADEGELARRGVARPSKAPPGPLRLIDVAGLDCCACTGTHVTATGEVGCIHLVGAERVRSHLRVGFLCGGRAVEHVRRVARAAGDAASQLSVHVLGLPEAIARLEGEGREQRRRADALLGRVLDVEAAALAGSGGGGELAGNGAGALLLTRVFAERDSDEIQELARRLLQLGRAALLVSVAEGRATAVAVVPDGTAQVGAPQLLGPLLESLGGRGGGSPLLARGSAPWAGTDAGPIAEIVAALDGAADRWRALRGQ